MAGFSLIDWLFGRTNSAKSIQAQHARPYTTINPQPVAPENDTIRSDGTAMPYRGPDDLDNFGCETDAMRSAYLRLFREEPSLKSAIEGKAESIAALDVMVQPADDKRPDDVRAARFVDWCIKTSPHGFDGLLLNVLKPAFLLGWSCQEITLRTIDRDESAEWGGMVGLKHCRSLNTQTLRLRMDAFRTVLDVVNTVRGLASYPRRKVLLYTHNELFGNPFGSGDAAAAYRDANAIDNAMRLWSFAIKVYGGPFLKGKYTAKDRRKQLETALEAARQGGWITMPKEDEVEVINLATATSFSAFQEKVKKHEERVYTAVRGAYLPYMQGSSTGDTRGSADTSKSAGSDPKEYLVGVSACRAINRDVVPHLIVPNFPPGTGMPEVRLGGVNWSETKTQLDVAKSLKDLGHEVDEEYLAKVTGMPIKAKVVVPGVGPGLPGGGPGLPGLPGAGGPGGANPPTGPQTSPAGGGGGTPPTAPPTGLPTAGTGTAGAGPQQQATAQPAPAPDAAQPAPDAPPQPSDDTSAAVPPELLAAMSRAAESGDWPAVERLVSLGRHPETLTALLGGDDDGSGDNLTFADDVPAGFTGERKDKLGRNYRWENGRRVARAKDDTSGGDAKPDSPKRDVIAEAKQAKAGREPARQAAREAWTAAASGSVKVTAEHLPELADHLRSLTRDELREVNRLGGLKEEHVQRLLEHVGAKVATADSTTPVTPAIPATTTPASANGFDYAAAREKIADNRSPFPHSFSYPYSPGDLREYKPTDAPLASIPVEKLRGTQSDVTGKYVRQLASGQVEPRTTGEPVVVKDGDHYWIDDGHNRAAAEVVNGAKEVKARVFEYDPVTKKTNPAKGSTSGNDPDTLTTDDGESLAFRRPASHAVLGDINRLKAAGRDTSAAEVALANAHVTDEDSDATDHDHRQMLARRLHSSYRDAVRLGKGDAASVADTVLTGPHVGAQRIGTAGETVPFDPVHHEADTSVSTGQPVTVERHGHRIDEGGGREYVVGKAKVKAASK